MISSHQRIGGSTIVRRIAVFVPNWIGDVVMATPALRALRTKFGPRARLVGIMRPYVVDVLAGTPWLDETVTYERKQWRDMARLVRYVRAQSFDMAVLLSNSLTTGLIAWLGNARRRVGHAMHGRQWLLTEYPACASGRRAPRSAVDHYLDVVEILGCSVSDTRVELATLAKDRLAAAAAWRCFGWNNDQSVVALNTGGAYGAAKAWPAEYFAALAKRLIAARDVCVLLLCGPSERTTVRKICQTVDDPRVRSLADQTLGIGLSKACIERSCTMVTTDSGPRHFAAAFGVPAVTLFGPTDPRWSDNHHGASVDLQLDIACAPCSRRSCPHGHHRCMRNLTVEHVLTATLSLMDSTAAHRAA